MNRLVPQVGEVLLADICLTPHRHPRTSTRLYCVYILPLTARDEEVSDFEECLACLVLSSQNPPRINTTRPKFKPRHIHYRPIWEWVLSTFRQQSVRPNTLQGPDRRVPGYSQGVIVEAPLTVHQSCFKPLEPDDQAFRIFLGHQNIPVPFHLLNYFDPQPGLSQTSCSVISSVSVRGSDSDVSTEDSTPSEGGQDGDEFTDLSSDSEGSTDTKAGISKA